MALDALPNQSVHQRDDVDGNVQGEETSGHPM